MGVVQGCTPTAYCPDIFLTRAEMVKIALLTFGNKVDLSANTQPFSDVPTTHWATSYLLLAKAQGIVSGYSDGTFHPDAPITRVEALKILLAAAKKNLTGAAAAPFTDVDQMAWYTQYVNFAFANSIVGGYKDANDNLTGEFRPTGNVTRAEMAKMAILTLGLK